MTITRFKSSVLVAHEKSPAAPGYGATSETPLAISTGSKTFGTSADLALKVGQHVRLISRSSPDNWMDGQITGYAGSSMTVNVSLIGDDASGTHDDWDIVPVWVPDYVATKAGAETLSNKTISGGLPIVTDGGRVGITNDSSPMSSTPALLTVHNATMQTSNALNVRNYPVGTAASPYQNHDTTLTEVYNDVQEDSLNRSWALSAPNGYNKIPPGVTDSGSRVGVIGWAVSVLSTSYGKTYKHEGTLASQIGVQGNCGFQGAGSGTDAVIQDAIGVRGEVLAESTGSTIQNGRAGAFVSQITVGIVENNYAVYAVATGGTTVNYSFYGAAGKFRNEGDAEVGGKLTIGSLAASQTGAKVTARSASNAFEFGHEDTNGYASVIGSTFSSGFPFVAFNAESDPTGNTFRTRGKLGVAIRSDNSGSLVFGRLTSTSASGQSLTESARFNASGHFLPGADNTMNIGSAAARVKEVFAGTGTINTSDAREKEWRGGLSEAELRVAKRLSKLIGIYRWLDAVSEKGDAARLHVGVTAQDVKAAFEAEGLDGFDYGLLCFDEWDAQAAVINDDGEVDVPAREAGDRYGVRYDELWGFVAAGFEARLTALEAN